MEDDDEEWKRIIETGNRLQNHWSVNIQSLADSLVRLECVGKYREEDHWLLNPESYVKSATIYLRRQLGVHTNAQVGSCSFCRQEKRELCGKVEFEPWTDGEMAALLRIVYQVRCNLVHGDKRLHANDIQTDRDRALVETSTEILDRVLGHLLSE